MRPLVGLCHYRGVGATRRVVRAPDRLDSFNRGVICDWRGQVQQGGWFYLRESKLMVWGCFSLSK